MNLSFSLVDVNGVAKDCVSFASILIPIHNIRQTCRRIITLVDIEEILDCGILEISLGEVSVLDGQIAMQSFLVRFLQNAFLDRLLADEPIDVKVSCITDSMAAILSL